MQHLPHHAKARVKGLAQRINDAGVNLVSDLLRSSDPGVVVRADGRVEVMRWGFHRSFNPSINNARSYNLEGGMWNDAFRSRRCVIPDVVFLRVEAGRRWEKTGS